VALVAIGMTLWLIHQSNHHKAAVAAETQAKQDAVNQYVLRLNSSVQEVASPLPGGTQVATWQDLPTQLADLQSGKLSTADAIGYAKNVAAGSAAAGRQIHSMDVPKLVDTERFPDLLDLQDSQEMIVKSLLLYSQVGHLMENAANSTGDEQAAFIKEAQALTSIAAKLFNDGYQKAINQQTAVGLPINPFPAQPPSPSPTPTGAPTTAPSPTGSASPQPSASPKPSASASGKNGGKGAGGKNGGNGKHTPKPTPTAS
jgi:hypothetical protein